MSPEKGKISAAIRNKVLGTYGLNCGECGIRMLTTQEFKVLKKGKNIIPALKENPNLEIILNITHIPDISRKLSTIATHVQALQATSGHQIAVANAGSDSIDNLRGEHYICNTMKKTRPTLLESQRMKNRTYALTYIPKLLQLYKAITSS